MTTKQIEQDGKEVATVGQDDSKLTLWNVNGIEWITTNGDPVGEMEEGFAEVRAQILG